MRLFRHRRLFVAGIGLVAISVPLVITSSGGGAGLLKASPASATGADTIQYVQTTGSSGTYIEYVPGNGSKPTTQSVTSGGGCATPSISGTPLIAFSGYLYSNGTYTPGTGTAGIVGAYKQRTGVCSIPQDWSIDNAPSGSQTGAEELDFSVGSNALVAGRVFSRAQLYLQRSDKLSGAAVVRLVESLAGSQVATACYTLASTGTSYEVDTSTPDTTACTPTGNPAVRGFDTIAIQVLTGGESVSVVGPSSIFYLANQICGGQTLTTTSASSGNYGQMTASVTLQEPSTYCKSYTNFSAQQTVNADGTVNKVTEFDSFGSTGTHFTFNVDLGNYPYCTPDGTTGPICAPSQFSFDGTNYTDATYCSAASAANPICPTNKNFQYVNVGGTTYTHITETWDSLIDVWLKNG